MSKAKAPPAHEPPPPSGASFFPSAGSLALLTGLGVGNALWSLFLWAELVLARQGGTAFCALGEGMDCAALWDGAFASAIHDATQLPIAGWGLIFSLLSTSLPLFSLYRKAEGQTRAWQVSAIRLTAALGVVSVIGLAGVAIAAKTLCLGCLVTYGLVGAYAGVALYGWRQSGFAEFGAAAGRSMMLVVVAYLALLYPGRHTPKNAARAAQEALAQAAGGTSATATAHPSTPSATHGAAHAPRHTLGDGPSTGDPERDAKLFDLVRTLPPQLQQGLADSLAMYQEAPPLPPEPPRHVQGRPDAKLKIVEWTDARCGHCAQLHESIKQIEPIVPPGSFSVEPRHFPLDATCNPEVQRRSPDGVSCLAAMAQICLEGDARLSTFTGQLFANQQSLTPESIYALAAPFIARDALQACLDRPETQGKLQSDITYAMRHRLDGTPLVVLNGKKATSFGPFLYAMILTEGNGKHPAFAELPPPNPQAHMH